MQLADFFQVQWKEGLENIITTLSPEDQLERSAIDQSGRMDDVDEVCNATQKWLTAILDVFENENSNIVEQVS